MSISSSSLLQKAFIESPVDKLLPQTAHSLPKGASCREAIELLVTERIGCVVVSDGNNPLAGIFTERDVLMKVWRLNEELSKVPVSSVMTPKPESLSHNASIARAVYLMAIGGFRHIPVRLRNGALGIVSVSDFIRFIFERVQKRLKQQEDTLEILPANNAVDRFFEGNISALSPTPPLFLAENTKTSDAVREMIAQKIGAVVVGDTASKKVSGIFTERDLVKKVILTKQVSMGSPLSSFMTRDPLTLQASASVYYALDAMMQGRFRHIPVVSSDEKIVGLLSVKNFISYLGQGIVAELEGRSS